MNTKYNAVVMIGLLVLSILLGPIAYNVIPKAEAQKVILKTDCSYLPAGGGGTFFSPLLPITARHYYMLNIMYDTLVSDTADDSSVKPWLAERWEISKDGKAYTFYLDKRAKWSDGKPLTADDVVFSYKYYNKTNLLFMPGIIAAVEALDTYTVRISTPKPSAAFLPLVADAMLIVPKHLWENVADPYKMPLPVALEQAPQLVVGSGPMILKEWKEGQYAIFAKNPLAWKGTPYIDEWHNIYYASAEARGIALKKGEIDYSDFFDNTQFVMLKDDPNIVIDNKTGRIGMGTRFGYNFRTYPLNIKEVRKAIDLAIDRTEVLSKASQGYAILGPDGLMNPQYTAWYNPAAQWQGLKYKTADERIAAANAMLDKLGFTKGADGIRATPNGTKLDFELLTSNTGANFIAGELAVGYLQKLGIKVTLKTSTTVHTDVWTAGRAGAKPPTWDLYIMPHGTSIDPDYLFLALYSNPPFIGTQGIIAAQAGPYNSTLNDLLLAESQEMNVTKRRELVNKLQMVIADLMPISMLTYIHGQIHVYRTDKFTGWNPSYTNNLGYNAVHVRTPDSRQGIMEIRPVSTTTTTMPPSVTTVTATRTTTATTTVTAPAEGISLWGWIAVVVAVVVCIPLGYMVGRRKPTT